METRLKIVRVQDIILNEEHSEWERCGRHESIGSILYTEVNASSPVGRDNSQLPYARPLFYSITQYPVFNEIVHLVLGPNHNYNEEEASQYYYLPPIGLQNHPNHNALPNQLSIEEPTLSNEEIEAGATNKEGEKEVKLGTYFTESETIRPLRPYEGDVMVEGRYGNSIRLGSTTYNQLLDYNKWSNEGEVGNPITIIRNGQMEDTEKTSFEHIIEDIDGDDSSIYLCSKQQLTNFTPASIYTLSFGANLSLEDTQEPTRENTQLTQNTTEDPVLSSPPEELPEEVLEEEIEEVEVAEWDISGTEGDSPLFPGDQFDLPESYIIPEGENINDDLG